MQTSSMLRFYAPCYLTVLIVQAYSDDQACLIHAYLHRLEGDLANASC